jgi:hypothetical protein
MEIKYVVFRSVPEDYPVTLESEWEILGAPEIDLCVDDNDQLTGYVDIHVVLQRKLYTPPLNPKTRLLDRKP